MSYENYKTEDFVNDERFRAWVIENAECEFWTNWLLSHPKKMETIKKARILVSVLTESEIKLNSDRRQEIKSKIDASLKEINQIEIRSILTDNKLYRRPKFDFGIAAVFASFIISGILVFLLIQREITFQASIQEVPVTKEYVTISTQKGQKLPYKLPDGSVVNLNAESSISFVKDFEASERLVRLEGEAYFEVKKDDNKPFIVQTDAMSTRVLGTIFNVLAYPENQVQIVTLVEGQVNVKLSASEHEFDLNEGEQLTLSKNQTDSRKSRVHNFNHLMWKDGILFFDNENFSEVIPKLERWYGVEINVMGKTSSKHKVSGVFDNEYLSNVLKSISFYVEMEFEIERDKVNIKLNSK
ncbi:MAG: FecR domain-containing protein [Cyclobacteriaceae bacterium]|nr:FecR domain-containing protein [Cyclobacteriaceae bacterium]